MASLSVKDRAKMFGTLASPANAENDRSYRRMGNKVTSSPFKSPPASTKASPTPKFPPSPFASSSPAAKGTQKFPASPFSSNSPNRPIPFPAAGSSSTYPKPFSMQKEKSMTPLPSRADSPARRNSMDWPDEDGIPAPNDSKTIGATDEELKDDDDVKLSNNSSPFKVLSNQDTQGRLPIPTPPDSKLEMRHSPLKTLQVKYQQFKSPSPVKSNSLKALQNKREDASPLSNTKQRKSTSVILDKAPVEPRMEEQQLKAPVSAKNSTLRSWQNKETSSVILDKAPVEPHMEEQQLKAPVSAKNSTLRSWQNKETSSVILDKKAPDEPRMEEQQLKAPVSTKNSTLGSWQNKETSAISKVVQNTSTSDVPDKNMLNMSDVPNPSTSDHNGSNQTNGKSQVQSTRAMSKVVQKTSTSNDQDKNMPSKSDVPNSSMSNHNGSNQTNGKSQVQSTRAMSKVVLKTSKSDAPDKSMSDMSDVPNPSTSNHNGSSQTNGRSRVQSTRAMRLKKARRATVTSSSLAASKSLKQSLQAAKAVMQEEKRDAGSSDTSSRSSLSNKELSDIAKRALKRSKNKIQSGFNGKRKIDENQETNVSNDLVQQAPVDVIKNIENGTDRSNQEAQETGTIASRNSSHLGEEARQRAILSINARKERIKAEKKKTAGSIDIGDLGLEATKRTTLNDTSKTKTNESSESSTNIVQTLSKHSNDASKSRRLDHPAFAGRPGKSNASTAHILASFRQFNATRPPVVEKREDSAMNKQAHGLENELKRSLSGDDSLSSGTSMASLELDPTMHSVSERPGESIHSMTERVGESMHSMSGRFGDSMHSSSSRKQADQFYRMHRVHVISKTCNDTVISSLSGNTRSIQSIASQSAASKMMSPMKQTQNTSTSFRLDPTPEFSSQMMRLGLNGFSSPGPSNRSSHSYANSINSATPRVGHQSPSFRDRVDTSFLDTLEEIQSSSQETGLNSADLLDAALEAAIDELDFVKPPIINRNVAFNARTNGKSTSVSTAISILQSSSGRSHSPPGFIFKDTEESDVVGPPDPVGREGFALADSICGEEDSNSTSTYAHSEKMDNSFGAEINQGVMKQDVTVDFGDGIKAKEEPVYQKQGSTSTKKTVSTSIRSGMSSIQNNPVEVASECLPAFDSGNREPEGSTSIRTGLSGIQSQKEPNDTENSISIHTNVDETSKNNEKVHSLSIKDGGNEKKEDSGIATNMMENKTTLFTPTYPDTIQEENEAKSTQKSVICLKDENTSFSGLKVKLTATTDGSSGPGTTSGTSSLQPSSDPSTTAAFSLQPISDPSVTGASLQPSSDPSSSNTGMRMIPPIETDEITANEGMSFNGLSLLTPGSRSSRPWKTIGNAIKNVLAKASPRAAAATPSNDILQKDKDECENESLFSDDDDIFEGLEVEEDEQSVNKLEPQTKPKIDDKTPRLTNFKFIGNPNETSIRQTPTNSRRTSSSSKKTPSSSRRTPTNSKRTPSSSRRTSSNSRRTPTHSRRATTPRFDGIIKPPTNTPSQSQRRIVSSPAAVEVKQNTASLHSNDRSGMVVEESEVLHNVNSDITSSLIGGPISGGHFQFPKTTNETTNRFEIDHKANETNPVFPNDDGGSFTLLMEENDGESFTLLMEETNASFAERKIPKPKSEGISESKEQHVEFKIEENEEEAKQTGCMFLNFGCGITDPCSGLASLCTPGNKAEGDDVAEETVIGEVDGDKDCFSVSSRSQLTSLEKKVWNEWDRLNDDVISANGTEQTERAEDWKDDFDNKRETARDKLLEIASTALSSHMSGKSGKSSIIDDKNTTISQDPTVSASGSTESFSTRDTESGASGISSGIESGDSMGSYSQESTHYSTSYSSGDESDEASKDPSTIAPKETPPSKTSPSKTPPSKTPTTMMTPTAGPILLSFSQRSLMEKFSKQLTAVGVQVLKLNTRQQWQTRFFTVSTEQIALLAHEAISKTGDIAQCPKALLWLKKFIPKNGGYGIVNIDKNGHGGMLLVDLVDIQASDRRDDMVGNPIPKKLLDTFENSVLVTLKYKMKGILRSIEFRCRDNDEAQFLCTCMRVIRDLLRRERSLRQKLSKQAPNTKKTPTSSRR